jgi:hypothetical protein
MRADDREGQPPDEGRPPFFSSWTGMYVLVLSALAVQVAIYWVLTRMFE